MICYYACMMLLMMILMIFMQRQSLNKARRDKRNAFMACVAYSSMNNALMDYKQRMCSDGQPKVSYKREINMLKKK